MNPSLLKSPSLNHLKTACSNCGLHGLCLPFGMSQEEMGRFDELVNARYSIKRGSYLYCASAPFSVIYAIRTGSFKSDMLCQDGRRHVTGFSMPGELLGLDGIESGHYISTATALEDSVVCAIDFTRLEDLSQKIVTLQKQFNRIMSREIVNDRCNMMVLGNMRAEERLASFLLNISRRYASRGYSSHEFQLRMKREDIGSYLGLKIETVSRTLSALQKEGYIHVSNKHVTIIDMVRLTKLSSMY